MPIFQGGRLTANLQLARAQTEEAALHYRGMVHNALREVEDGSWPIVPIGQLATGWRTACDQRI